MRAHVPIERLSVSAYTIPTDEPEADGTLEWDKTTLLVVELDAGNKHGIGYSYADASAVQLIAQTLKSQVIGQDALRIMAIWSSLVARVRNLGRPGVASTAISAIDIALWDLKAKLLDQPLFLLLGATRDRVPIYGSGGFTSYSIERLQKQLGGWAERGIARVKMKVGQKPERDLDRVRAARAAIGARTELFVDANGAYTVAQARAMADGFAESGVTWFEEPVSSDNLEGMRWVRAHAPAGMEIAAGEYGYDAHYFKRMLASQAIDVLQADATRCTGVTGFLQAAALCEAFDVPLSAHTAPSIHAHLCCAVGRARHVEYFHDHVRIERMLFDGALEPDGGTLAPSRARAGLGIDFKHSDASKYRVGGSE